jgi:4-carboxymuconolactone decarboxylase
VPRPDGSALMAVEPVSMGLGITEGLTTYGKLRGAKRAEGMRSTIDSGEVGSTMTALAIEFVFGRVWARAGLDGKQRSLVTIGILIALRQTDELKNHVHLGLSNGLSAHEIEEAIIQAAAYAGFPAAHVASNVLIEVLEGLETDSPK